MGAVAAGLIGFFAFLILRLTAPHMTLLFTDLDIRDSNTIVRQLETRNIPFELRGDGSTILVPKDEVLRLRMRLAEEGLPAGGNIGYELFDKTEALGTTSFVQNVNHLRAMEGELMRTIRTLDRVESVRVHLVLPERELFSRERVEPSASIVLKTRGNIDTPQIAAIQHLVASAVQGLKPSRISIVDETGRLLASGNEADGAGALVSSFEERRLAFERRLREEIDQIVSSVVGEGRARINVLAEIDYNRITQTSDVFDPEGRVVRSTQTREEKSASRDGKGDGVTVGNELPGVNPGNGAAPGSTQEQANTTEEVVNYEISRTTKTEVTEAGRIKRLSVAVLVDGNYATDQSGNVTYTPRAQEQLDQIAALVRSAVGFDRARGDQLEVVNLQFAEVARLEAVPTEDGFLNLTKDDYFYFAELAVLLIVAALVLLFVVRPLVRRIVAPEVMNTLPAGAADGTPQLSGPDGRPLPAPEGTAALPRPENRTSEMIDIAQVNGQIQASSIQKVGDLVEQNPNEAVAIIRQWMGEAA